MFHFHVRYIAKGTGVSAEGVMQYITRTGRHEKRGDKVREVMSLNMPGWASSRLDASEYWRAADSSANRVNARTAYAVEFALPKSLSMVDQRRLVVNYATALSRLSTDRVGKNVAVPLTLSIHEGHGRNPHVHLLLSSSISDGIGRSPGLWFRRYNPKIPEIGGAQRSRSMAKKHWLLRARELWAEVANKALAACGLSAVLDHRSNAARGLLSEPGIHLGPSAAHLLRNNRSAPRVEKHRSNQANNQALLQMHEGIQRTRMRLAVLQEIQDLTDHARRVWQAIDAKVWQRLLVLHPLAADATAIRFGATALVLDGHYEQNKDLYLAAIECSLDRQLIGELAQHWQAIRTAGGIWLVRPDLDEVVLLAKGYVATDAHDADALQALLTVASLLHFSDPVVATKPGLVDSMLAVVKSIGEDWPVRTLSPDSATSRLKKPL